MSRLALLATGLTAVLLAIAPSDAAAQGEEWRMESNPYQEDIPYTIGTTMNPGVVVEGVRWNSFTIDVTEDDVPRGIATVDAEVTVNLENRRSKSARVLVIFLLEDADGNPLERIPIPQFKVGGDRVKERTESVKLPGNVVRGTSRIYLFFEVLQ